MVDIDLSKGLFLCKLIKSPKTIGHFKKRENVGYSNLERFPWQLKHIKRIYPERVWKDVQDFESWLQQKFGKYENGIYYLICYRASLSHKFIGKGSDGKRKYKKIRKLEPFSKFQIQGGSVNIPKDFKRSARTNKVQRVYLLLKESNQLQEQYGEHLHRGKIKFENRW